MIGDIPQCSLSPADLEEGCRRLGLEMTGDSLVVPFFGRPLTLTAAAGILDADGRAPTPSVAGLIAAYVLEARPPDPSEGRTLVSFREFPEAGPLVDRFSDNTGKLVAATFAGRTADLLAAAERLDGRPRTGLVAMDLFVAFTALPGVPMFLGFNDAEDGLPAQSRLYFYDTADRFIGLRHRFALGTYLAGHLIQER